MTVRHPLERLLSPLDPVPTIERPGSPPHDGRRIVGLAGAGPPQWLRGPNFRLYVRPSDPGDGTPIASFDVDDGGAVAVRRNGEELRVPFSLTEAHDNLIAERWREQVDSKGLTPGQLDVFYRVKRVIPRRVQLAARRALMRRQRLPDFPAWPFEAAMVRLVELYGLVLATASDRDEVRFRWFWPNGANAAAALTHDVESADGLRLAVEIADLEESRGFRSSFNVVASWYPIDHGVLRELSERGFEIGIHGVYHDRSMFSSRESFLSQQGVVREAAASFGAEGFRSPATHRVFDWLGELPVAYDCTMPHSDPYEPIPGGCCTIWPFFIGRVVELPYTLPQDHTLFTLLSKKSIDLWVAQLDRIEEAHGLVECLSHPDPGYLGDPGKRALYAEFLDVLRARSGLWHALPREVARWWRSRDEGSDERLVVAAMRFGPEAEVAIELEER